MKCGACFTFNRISESRLHLFISASSLTLMMKIVLCSSKFHVKCISILTTLGSVSQGGPSVPCLASPVEFWSEVCQCYYLHILGVLVFMIFWQK